MANAPQIASIIRRASQAIERVAGKRMEPFHVHDMTYRQMLVLVAVYNAPGCKQRYITDVTGIDRTTVTVVVDTLTKRKLLKQPRNKKDRRSACISCTAEGERLAKSGQEVLASYNADLCHAVEPDLRALDRALVKLMGVAANEDNNDAASK